MPVWKYFLGVTENKRSLIKFLGQYLSENLHIPADSAQSVYLAGCQTDHDTVQVLVTSGSHFYPELESNHEEADTRMILHVLHADKTFSQSGRKGRIVIQCKDTDVLVLGIYYFLQLNSTDEMWIKTGVVTSTTELRRYIPVHDICNSMPHTLCRIMPAAHTLSGCDTTYIARRPCIMFYLKTQNAILTWKSLEGRTKTMCPQQQEY